MEALTLPPSLNTERDCHHAPNLLAYTLVASNDCPCPKGGVILHPNYRHSFEEACDNSGGLYLLLVSLNGKWLQ